MSLLNDFEACELLGALVGALVGPLLLMGVCSLCFEGVFLY